MVNANNYQLASPKYPKYTVNQGNYGKRDDRPPMFNKVNSRVLPFFHDFIIRCEKLEGITNTTEELQEKKRLFFIEPNTSLDNLTHWFAQDLYKEGYDKFKFSDLKNGLDLLLAQEKTMTIYKRINGKDVPIDIDFSNNKIQNLYKDFMTILTEYAFRNVFTRKYDYYAYHLELLYRQDKFADIIEKEDVGFPYKKHSIQTQRTDIYIGKAYLALSNEASLKGNYKLAKLNLEKAINYFTLLLPAEKALNAASYEVELDALLEMISIYLSSDIKSASVTKLEAYIPAFVKLYSLVDQDHFSKYNEDAKKQNHLTNEAIRPLAFIDSKNKKQYNLALEKLIHTDILTKYKITKDAFPNTYQAANSATEVGRVITHPLTDFVDLYYKRIDLQTNIDKLFHKLEHTCVTGLSPIETINKLEGGPGQNIQTEQSFANTILPHRTWLKGDIIGTDLGNGRITPDNLRKLVINEAFIGSELNKQLKDSTKVNNALTYLNENKFLNEQGLVTGLINTMELKVPGFSSHKNQLVLGLLNKCIEPKTLSMEQSTGIFRELLDKNILHGKVTIQNLADKYKLPFEKAHKLYGELQELKVFNEINIINIMTHTKAYDLHSPDVDYGKFRIPISYKKSFDSKSHLKILFKQIGIVQADGKLTPWISSALFKMIKDNPYKTDYNKKDLKNTGYSFPELKGNIKFEEERIDVDFTKESDALVNFLAECIKQKYGRFTGKIEVAFQVGYQRDLEEQKKDFDFSKLSSEFKGIYDYLINEVILAYSIAPENADKLKAKLTSLDSVKEDMQLDIERAKAFEEKPRFASIKSEYLQAVVQKSLLKRLNFNPAQALVEQEIDKFTQFYNFNNVHFETDLLLYHRFHEQALSFMDQELKLIKENDYLTDTERLKIEADIKIVKADILVDLGNFEKASVVINDLDDNYLNSESPLSKLARYKNRTTLVKAKNALKGARIHAIQKAQKQGVVTNTTVEKLIQEELNFARTLYRDVKNHSTDPTLQFWGQKGILDSFLDKNSKNTSASPINSEFVKLALLAAKIPKKYHGTLKYAEIASQYKMGKLSKSEEISKAYFEEVEELSTKFAANSEFHINDRQNALVLKGFSQLNLKQLDKTYQTILELTKNRPAQTEFPKAHEKFTIDILNLSLIYLMEKKSYTSAVACSDTLLAKKELPSDVRSSALVNKGYALLELLKNAIEKKDTTTTAKYKMALTQHLQLINKVQSNLEKDAKHSYLAIKMNLHMLKKEFQEAYDISKLLPKDLKKVKQKTLEHIVTLMGFAQVELSRDAQTEEELKEFNAFMTNAHTILKAKKNELSAKFVNNFWQISMYYYVRKNNPYAVIAISDLTSPPENKRLSKDIQIPAELKYLINVNRTTPPSDAHKARLQRIYALQEKDKTKRAYAEASKLLADLMIGFNSETDFTEYIKHVAPAKLPMILKTLALAADLELELDNTDSKNILRVINITNDADLVKIIKKIPTDNPDKLEFYDQLLLTCINYHLLMENNTTAKAVLEVLNENAQSNTKLLNEPTKKVDGLSYINHPSILLAQANYMRQISQLHKLEEADEPKALELYYKALDIMNTEGVYTRPQVKFFIELGRNRTLSTLKTKKLPTINFTPAIDIPKYHMLHKEFLVINSLDNLDFADAITQRNNFYEKSVEDGYDAILNFPSNTNRKLPIVIGDKTYHIKSNNQVEIYYGFALNGTGDYLEAIKVFQELAGKLDPREKGNTQKELQLSKNYVNAASGLLISHISNRDDVTQKDIDLYLYNGCVPNSSDKIITKIAKNPGKEPESYLSGMELISKHFHEEKLKIAINAYFGGGFFEEAENSLNDSRISKNTLLFSKKDQMHFNLLHVVVLSKNGKKKEALEIFKKIKQAAIKDKNLDLEYLNAWVQLSETVGSAKLTKELNNQVLSETTFEDIYEKHSENMNVQEANLLLETYLQYVENTKQFDKIEDIQDVILSPATFKNIKNNWLINLIIEKMMRHFDPSLTKSVNTFDSGHTAVKSLQSILRMTWFLLDFKDQKNINLVTNAILSEIKQIHSQTKLFVDSGEEPKTISGKIQVFITLWKSKNYKAAEKMANKAEDQMIEKHKDKSLSNHMMKSYTNLVNNIAKMYLEQREYEKAITKLNTTPHASISFENANKKSIIKQNILKNILKLKILYTIKNDRHEQSALITKFKLEETKLLKSINDSKNKLTNLNNIEEIDFRLLLVNSQILKTFNKSDIKLDALIQKYEKLSLYNKRKFMEDMEVFYTHAKKEKHIVDDKKLVPLNYNQAIDMLIDKAESDSTVLAVLEKIVSELEKIKGFELLKLKIYFALYNQYYDTNIDKRDSYYSKIIEILKTDISPWQTAEYRSLLDRFFRDKTSDTLPSSDHAKHPLRPNFVFNPFTNTYSVINSSRLTNMNQSEYATSLKLATIEKEASIKEEMKAGGGKLEFSADIFSSYVQDQSFDNVKISADEIVIKYSNGQEKTIKNPFGKNGLTKAELKWVSELAGLKIELSANTEMSFSSDKNDHFASTGDLKKKVELAAKIGKYFKSTGTTVEFSFAYRPVDNELAKVTLNSLSTEIDKGTEFISQVFINQNVGDKWKFESMIRIETPHDKEEKDSLMTKFAVVYKDRKAGISRLFITNIQSIDLSHTGSKIDDKTIIGAEYIKMVTAKFKVYLQATYTDATNKEIDGTGLTVGAEYKHEDLHLGGRIEAFNPSEKIESSSTPFNLDVYAEYRDIIGNLISPSKTIPVSLADINKTTLNVAMLKEKNIITVNSNGKYKFISEKKLLDICSTLEKDTAASVKKLYYENKVAIYTKLLKMDEHQVQLMEALNAGFNKGEEIEASNKKLQANILEKHYQDFFDRIDSVLKIQYQSIGLELDGKSDVLSAGLGMSTYFQLLGVNFIAGVGLKFNALADSTSVLPHIRGKYEKQLSPKNKLIIEGGANPFLIWMDAYIKTDIGKPGGWYASLGTYMGLSKKYDSNKKEAGFGISYIGGLKFAWVKTYHGGIGKELRIPIWALPIAPIIMPFYLDTVQNPGVYEIMEDGTLMSYNPDTKNYMIFIPDTKSKGYKKWEKALSVVDKPIVNLKTKHRSFSSLYLLKLFKSNDIQKQEFIDYLISKGWMEELQDSQIKFTVSKETLQNELSNKYYNYKKNIINLMEKTNQNVDTFFRKSSITNIFSPQKTEQKQVLAELLKLIDKHKVGMKQPTRKTESNVDSLNGLEKLDFLNVIYLNDDNYNGYIEDTIHISTQALNELAIFLKGKTPDIRESILLEYIQEKFCKIHRVRENKDELYLPDIITAMPKESEDNNPSIADLLNQFGKIGAELIIGKRLLKDIIKDKDKLDGFKIALNYLISINANYKDILKHLVLKIDSQVMTFIFTKLNDKNYTINFPHQLLDDISKDMKKNGQKTPKALLLLEYKFILFQVYNKEIIATSNGKQIDISVDIMPSVEDGIKDISQLQKYTMDIVITGSNEYIKSGKNRKSDEKTITPVGHNRQIFTLVFDMNQSIENQISFINKDDELVPLYQIIKKDGVPIEYTILAKILHGGNTKVPSVIGELLARIKKAQGLPE